MTHIHLPGHGTIHLEDDQPPQQPRLGRRILKWAIIGILVSALLAIVYLAYTLSRISTDPLDFRGLSADINGRTNILILGVGDKGHSGEKLSDTVMVMSLHSGQKKAAFFSLPRDLRVPIPGEGSAKINQAHAIGGPELAVQTVEKVLGIPIHYYLRTDFTGLEQLVDAVGGLDVEVKERLYDPEYPCADNPARSCGIDIKPGRYLMNGEMALQYSRCRKGTCGNDFGRAERQQEILAKLQDKMVESVSWTRPLTADRMLAVIREHVRTDLSAPQLLRTGHLWRQIPEDKITRVVFSTAPDGFLRSIPGTSDLAPVGGSFVPLQKSVKTVFDN
jgi:polyisoprenyl-teichoic acid--peptidoglycan teichoic acid transferase